MNSPDGAPCSLRVFSALITPLVEMEIFGDMPPGDGP
jgi:hypothetical protein